MACTTAASTSRSTRPISACKSHHAPAHCATAPAVSMTSAMTSARGHARNTGARHPYATPAMAMKGTMRNPALVAESPERYEGPSTKRTATGTSAPSRTTNATATARPIDGSPRAASRVSSTPKPKSTAMVSAAAHAVHKVQRPKSSTPRLRAMTSDVAKEIAVRARLEVANAADMPIHLRSLEFMRASVDTPAPWPKRVGSAGRTSRASIRTGTPPRAPRSETSQSCTPAGTTPGVPPRRR